MCWKRNFFHLPFGFRISHGDGGFIDIGDPQLSPVRRKVQSFGAGPGRNNRDLPLPPVIGPFNDADTSRTHAGSEDPVGALTEPQHVRCAARCAKYTLTLSSLLTV